MFRCKRDVDRHVAELEDKYKSDNERSLKYQTVARLYFQVGEPETALKYLDKYCAVRTSSAVAYKLRGQILENLAEKCPPEQVHVNKVAALEAYKTAYELDLSLKELLIKICELMSELPIRDSGKARYWIDQGEKQFPRNKTVVKLKEKMNGNNDNEYNGNGNGYQSTDISPSSQNKDDDVEADNSILWSTNNMRQGNSFALNGSYRVEDYLNSTPGRGSNTPARRFPPRPSPERLANQIRTVEATQEKIVATMTENSRSLLETQEAILGELRRTREEMTRGLRENTESVKDLRSEVNSIWRDVREEMRRISSKKQEVVVVKQEEKAPVVAAAPTTPAQKPLTVQDLSEALSIVHMHSLNLAGLYAPAPRHPLPPMAGGPMAPAGPVINPMSMHHAAARPPMVNPIMPPASGTPWPANTPTPTQPLPPQGNSNLPVNVVITSSEKIPSAAETNSTQALPAVTIPAAHRNKPVEVTPSPAVAVTPTRPHNYQINIPQNSPQATSPFTDKEGPAVPITTSAILANIPAPVFSAVSAKTTVASPKQQTATPTVANTTSSSSSGGGFGDKFKPKAGQWECQGCFLRQNADLIQCPACQTAKPGHEAEVKEKEKAKEEASKPAVSFGAGGGFKFSFGNAATPPASSSAGTGFALGAQATSTPATSANTEPAKPSPFAGFSFGNSGAASNSGFSFSAVQPIGGSPNPVPKSSPVKKEEPEEADEGHDDSTNHDPHFEPIIPLPAEVEVKTGEEDEEVKFQHRAKVYRWDKDTKEWKERGLGDLKILYHPENNTFRVLLRREQVHKIACNHYIKTEMKLEPMPKSETQVTWFAMDYCENEDGTAESKVEKLAAKFKLAETKEDFVKAFEAAQEHLRTNGGSGSPRKADSASGGSGVQTIQSNAGEDFELSFNGQGLKLNNADDAKPVVAKINATKSFTTLTFSGNTIGIEAAAAIGKALEKHPELKYAHWKDMFTGRMKTEIPPALKNLSNGMMTANVRLVELDLSDNAFGPIGMDGIVDLLKSPCCYTLQELKLNNTGCGVTGGKVLAKTLMDCYKNSKGQLALKVFILGRSRQENEGATALAEVFKKMGSLEEVVMPQNGIYFEGLTALADAFTNNPNLRILNMNDNTFTEKGAKPMADAISKLQKLEVLNLGDCLLGTEGARHIAYAVKDGHHNLKEWMMDSNEIRAAGGFAILDAIKNKNNIQKLEIGTNQFGAEACGRLMKKLAEINKRHVMEEIEDDEEPDDDDEIDPAGDDDDEDDDDDEGGDDSENKVQNMASFSFASSGSTDSKKTTIFGGAAPAASNSIFGKSTPNATTSGIFGGGSVSSSASPSIFGTPSSGSSTTFGGNTSGSVFGGFGTNTSSPNTGSIFGQATPSSGGGIFGGSKPAGSSIFGGAAAKSESSGIDLSASKDLPTFGSISAGTGDFAFGKKTEGFSFAGTGASVFGGSNKSPSKANANDNEGAEEDDEHDPHFEPIIEMPDLVTVTTGEEDEEVIFKHRAKVYRFDTDTKEWKERGVGDIKILHHPQRKTYRILLRRDQILKIACNHYITLDQKLEPMQSSETALTWFAMDFTDDPSGKLEKLAVRFKLAETKDDFKKAFETAQSKLKTSGPVVERAQLVQNDEDDEDDEYEDEETAEDEQSEETDNMMFERECDLLEVDGETKIEENLGRAYLKIIYDDDVYGARIIAVKANETNEEESYLCNHIIAVQTQLEVDQGSKRCTWSAFDFSDDPPTYRTFVADFSTSDGGQEDAQSDFVSVFNEGKEYAEQGEILEQPVNADINPEELYYGEGGDYDEVQRPQNHA